MKNKNRNVSKRSILAFLFIVVIGLLVMVYPIVSSKLNYKKSLERINNYSASVSKNPSKINEDLLEQARKYNNKIAVSNIADSFIQDSGVSDEYLSLLNLSNNGIIGYIKIPKIDVEIPIYHSTSSKSLQKGVGHFEGSSLPIGGKSTHAILSGHRGLPSSKVFTDLDQLEKKDMFYIYVLDEKLAYEVDQIKIIKPSETKDLTIFENEDYVTLVTCTPYAINTHRLLVRGKRVKYNENILNNIKASKKITTPDIIFFGGLIVAFIIVVFTIVKILKLSKRKHIDEISSEVSELKKESKDLDLDDNEILEKNKEILKNERHDGIINRDNIHKSSNYREENLERERMRRSRNLDDKMSQEKELEREIIRRSRNYDVVSQERDLEREKMRRSRNYDEVSQERDLEREKMRRSRYYDEVSQEKDLEREKMRRSRNYDEVSQERDLERERMRRSSHNISQDKNLNENATRRNRIYYNGADEDKSVEVLDDYDDDFLDK